MHEITVRKAIKQDAKILTELSVKAWAEDFAHTFSGGSEIPGEIDGDSVYSEDHFNQAITKDVILIAEQGNQTIGFLRVGQVHPMDSMDPLDQGLHSIYIIPDFRHKGVGKLLMDAAFAQLKLKNAKDIYLQIGLYNLAAKKFVEKCGFEVVGERQFSEPSTGETSSYLLTVRHI